jgi:hypothetical protein|tara:strand:- start:153 stop:605 length:453 start_codon:yes stop_codon:yes gene_type:complete
MNFCKECDNYLTLQMKESTKQNQLIYSCNNCGFEEEFTKESIGNNITETDDGHKEFCIYKNYYDKKDILTHNENLKFLSEDPTLPRVNNITCPNNDCVSNSSLDIPSISKKTDKKTDKTNINEVVYLIINEQDMIFQYLCCHCKTAWTNR